MKKIITMILFFILFDNFLEASGVQNIIKQEKVKRNIALIIGNNDYSNLPYLKNPLNDARLMREVFKKKGFVILYKENATIKDMKKLLRKFTPKIHNSGISIYYFSGHSANVDGKNYMVGVDASLDDKSFINHEAIPLNTIIKKMNSAHNKLNILISDTCRNTVATNPFDNNHFGRGVGNGLLSLANTRDIYIAYTTASSEIKRDGKKSFNGILTNYFVKNLKQEGLTINKIFTDTRNQVYADTQAVQNPNIRTKINQDFFFIFPKVKDTRSTQ